MRKGEGEVERGRKEEGGGGGGGGEGEGGHLLFQSDSQGQVWLERSTTHTEKKQKTITDKH